MARISPGDIKVGMPTVLTASENKKRGDLNSTVKQFMKSRNNNGPCIEPWGTPLPDFASEDLRLPTRTQNLRFVGSSQIQLLTVPSVPNASSFVGSKLWLAGPKAF